MTRTNQPAARGGTAPAPRRGGRPAVLSRTRILEIARQIPARELTMPIVARRLDVSAAALYRHFESRDALLTALGAELASAFEVRAADAANWRGWLLDTSTALFRFLVDNPVILAASDWAHVDHMGRRLLDAVFATLEGAGFDTVSAIEVWGMVSGHAYLGARLLHDAPPARMPATSDARDAHAQRWQALADARGTSDPHELLEHSLRWIVANLPEPATPARRAARNRRQCRESEIS
jgi:AcrR family transcriptional regulator